MHGKRFETYSSLHVDQQRFDIEFFFNGVPWQPSLAPVTERAHKREEFVARFGQLVFRALFTVGTRHHAGAHKPLQAFRQHCSRDAGYGAADVIKPSIAKQQLANDKQRPSPSEHFMGACDRAELAVT
jgi:hypothetical protein